MTRPLRFSAFVMNTTSHIVHGAWRKPEAEQSDFSSLEHWVSLAKQLERGKFDFVFFADVVGLYDDHRGSWEKFVESGLQIPSNDPTVIASAIAYATEHLGIALTSSILQEHPFNFARKMSTLDHASNGRIAWNIVTSLSPNAWRNFGYGDLALHEDRYAWADEYVDVVYKLWEGSWDDGALLQDKASGRHGDFSKVHKIDHVGARYSVEGPHLVTPSPQRTPLLFQAGSSPTGRRFAARNAEAQFIASPTPEAARSLIADTRRLVVEAGRSPGDLEFFQGLSFVIGSTESEARRREAELDEYVDDEAMIAHAAGGIGIDLGSYDLDTPIGQVQGEGSQSTLAWLREAITDREPTVRDLAHMRTRSGRVVGTPESIADRLEQWRDAGVDGINVINSTIPGSYLEFIDHLMPVLRQRGLAQREYGRGTVRAKLTGRDRLPVSHPAARYRGAFS
ncbi:LLM class flavin-dependent oxidoreductase [Rhodococcus sp. 15-725-2-2b]|uniref:LLM class flavin-dependent oxidoreductase n=1 Tax=unclassified Rhodococcus (in: high G+C Gram-positive bacteria) TaxID=192944 RepID=UPI000B9C70E1|nr:MULTISPECIES: LLM class flavin-dependent oxidoreductase [unclassified Rhodococcus (in: high G+C Gram-positive bacteria)]OZC68667.1 LLM class flavin-dependent oxidoreductase [Rhodococcus sp. 06-469-3-2]OZD45344.1 LLM class flavin-dependent oxidoreductase [Rhodococcus sp. 06-1477-1A]OZE08291.1 LLM class flavin-dependent oxidoreductase [Rhodococcus sp. 05-2255-3B1]OZE11673.1 LLM class flavin-dependent oxidoreductase [Rhodococcus sp. 05-2255-3C]OZE23122.1 LLM class flavin-dependent oxidoreducta